MKKIEELKKRKSALKKLSKKEPEEKRTPRINHFRKTGEIKIYPTELSFEYTLEDKKIVKGSCLRAMYYKFHGVPETEPVDIKLLETFELGYAIEDIIKRELTDLGELTPENEEVVVLQQIGSEGVVLSGRIDAVLNDGTLVEIKSFKGHKYTNELLSGHNGKHPMLMETHIGQTAAYLAAEKYKGNKKSELIIWYKDRKSLDDFLLKITMDDYGNLFCNDNQIITFSFQSSLERMDKFARYIKEGKIPPRDYGYYDKKDVLFLIRSKEVTQYIGRKIANGDKVLPFKCDFCNHKTLCLNSEV